jgi:hypothetical protein
MDESGEHRFCWRDLLRRLARMAVIDQGIAVGISLLLLDRPGLTYRMALGISTAYSQCIGLLCGTVMIVVEERLVRLPRRLSLVLRQASLAACGATGALIAAALLGALGTDVGPGRLLRVLVGATIAIIVGASMNVIGSLRSALGVTERRLHERELAEEQLIRSKTEAELAALRSRIDPHFLFNTLNSIASLIREDPVRAEAATLQLASLFRYALQAHRRQMVALADEVEIVQRYLEIEQLRLGDRLAFEISISPDLAGHRVPALLLQPLVENAVRHGIAPSVDGGVVRLRGWRQGDRACLSVSDSGSGAGEAGGSGEGLDNGRRRLRALYGDRASLTLQRVNGATETLIVTPMEENEDAVAAHGDRRR